ncbi:rCG36888 [Rattus norvegicus]|uniref:RCG36888 n=1 Tax=Rattus norvegicus TaxID=10116 RepID=A6HTR1_RAT|nr:rCG36888 [Rattus norvegicus]
MSGVELYTAALWFVCSLHIA